MFQLYIQPKRFLLFAFLILSSFLATVNAQTVLVEPTEKSRGQAASSVDGGSSGKGQDPKSNELPQKVDKDKKLDSKIGKVIFPTYDFELGKKKLSYGLYLPTSFEESKPYPLVVVLHGLNSNPGQILGYPELTKYADKNGYILVAPMGYNERGWYGSRGKGGGRGKDPDNLGELSEQDVMNVLKLTRSNYKIDSNRIYLFGHSMGGGGSMHLAMKYPNIWAAIAVVAPAIYGDRSRLESGKNIPAYVVQGDRDRLVSVRETRQWVEQMKILKMKHKYVEVKNGGHVFVAWQHFDGIFKFFADNPKQDSKKAKKD
ncbi:alpha/beta hydrolase-fold protein [Mariniblastus sp.]|nr:alpha/beta hydrolase-fold protein [Mariniblastus sp.]MDB4386486.1 alpha/beta hydrolase-fold protein [bacterium]MDA7925907.1 alpha/beta hydrolase-fold protein [Mariniblastus sp.]MDA7928707.1 alpha/beta hydrolase-fold protein [Mariniblastus sp.]MDB4481275.1 alpha/beta hydrolase-fold protein [bacterium]